MTAEPLVSIALPVYNGQDTIENVAKSVLAQDYDNVELLIADNASTDGTEEICRELALADSRVVYHRRPQNIGLVPNFMEMIPLARGNYLRWIGDDDWIDPSYVSRCMAVFAEDERLLLVTTQLEYLLPDGSSGSATYDGIALRSPDPAVRFAEMLRLLTAGYAVLDPLYGLFRRAPLAAVPRRNVLRGDEVYAARLALAGPWGHLPQVLGGRGWVYESLPAIAPRLGVPRWQARVAGVIEARELLRAVTEVDLSSRQLRRAQAAVARHCATRLSRTAARASRKIKKVAGDRGRESSTRYSAAGNRSSPTRSDQG